MRYKQFHLKGYRAIDDAVVEVNKNQLVPIIGVNEAGKTSILQAILAFEKSQDNANGGKHLEYKNKYSYKSAPCTISAQVYAEVQQELADLSGALSLSANDKKLVEQYLDSIWDNKECFEIERDLETKKFHLINTKLPDKYHNKCINFLQKTVPLILYFDDFTDRVPPKISFNKDYNLSGEKKSKSNNAEWQRLIEEIFERSTGSEYCVTDFLSIEDNDDRDNLLSDVADKLNEEIMDDWIQLKKRGPKLGDEEDNLQLLLDYTPYTDGSVDFHFKVQDKSKGNKSRKFNIVDRSKGFQWFFIFTLKLKFNSKYKQNPSGAIYLLDEPGSYLHSSAQDELLKELNGISKTNVIFYCTHSQHLLNPEQINISSIKIASRESGAICINSINSSDSGMSQGALTPLYEALRSNFSFDSIGSEKVIVTEGITDFYFLKMMSQYSSVFNLTSVKIIPGAGAGNLKDLISIVVATTDLFYVVFDKDAAGTKEAKKYRKYFGNKVAEHFLFYGDKESSENFVLESYFLDEEKELLESAVGTRDVKIGIVDLYYSDDTVKKEFFNSVSQDFLGRFNRLASFLNKLEPADHRAKLKLGV